MKRALQVQSNPSASPKSVWLAISKAEKVVVGPTQHPVFPESPGPGSGPGLLQVAAGWPGRGCFTACVSPDVSLPTRAMWTHGLLKSKRIEGLPSAFTHPSTQARVHGHWLSTCPVLTELGNGCKRANKREDPCSQAAGVSAGDRQKK